MHHLHAYAQQFVDDHTHHMFQFFNYLVLGFTKLVFSTNKVTCRLLRKYEKENGHNDND